MRPLNHLISGHRYQNFIFLAIFLSAVPSIAVFIFGGPPRMMISSYVIVFLATCFFGYYLSLLLLVGVILLDIVLTISLYFYLSPGDILYSLKYMYLLGLHKDGLYLALMVTGAGAVSVMIWLHRKIHVHALAHAAIYPKRDNRFVAFIILIGALLHLVEIMRENTMEYGAGISEPAIAASRLDNLLEQVNGRDVIFIMVESLGLLADPSLRGLIWQPVKRGEIQSDYEIFEGAVNYKGSTLAAESRELCDNTIDPLYLDQRADQCLPFKMHGKGYQSVAVHGFIKEFFRREEWYPLIGFDDMYFIDYPDFPRENICGGVFLGTCDVDVPDFIANLLDKSDKPQFVYWLTLNSHVPVKPGEATRRLGCDIEGGPFAHRRMCYMAELWIDLSHSVADMTIGLPDTKKPLIFLVGDHAPPLRDRKAQSLFVPGKVPWMLLVPKDAKKELALLR